MYDNMCMILLSYSYLLLSHTTLLCIYAYFGASYLKEFSELAKKQKGYESIVHDPLPPTFGIIDLIAQSRGEL